MARREIGTMWDRENRNNINENFKELYNAQDRAIEEATQAVIDSAKLIWLEPVDTFADIPTTYPNPEIGHTVFVRDTGKVYRFYNGSWMEIQQIDAGPVNEVDTRLSAEIEENRQEIEENRQEIEENRQEIEQARAKADGTTFPVLRDRLNDVDNKIEILSRKTDWVDVRDFGAKSLDDDPDFDSTQAFQQAINSASAHDYWYGEDGGGIVFVPPGKYKISGVVIHSKVKLKGVRGATWIVPDTTKDDYAIKTIHYPNTTRHEAVCIEDLGFTSNPSNPIFISSPSQLGNGIYLGSGNGGTSLINITIFGLNVGIKLQNEFDVKIDGVEILQCNRNLIMTTSNTEVTNAVDLYKLRTEGGFISNLEIYDENPNAKSQVRSIQFNGGKFELGKIFIIGARDIKFNNANFVWDSGTDYMMEIGVAPPGVTLDPAVTGETDMIVINACSFQSPSSPAKFINNLKSFPILLANCVYSNIATESFKGNIMVIGGSVISPQTNAFNVSYMTGVQKTHGSDAKVSIFTRGYTTDDNLFNSLYNADDSVIDTNLKFSKNYVNTSGKVLVLNLMIRFDGSTYGTAYEPIINGISLGVANGAITGTVTDKQFTFILPPGATFRLNGDSGTSTILKTTIYYI